MKKLAILFSLFFLVLGGSIEAQSGHYKGGKGSLIKVENTKTQVRIITTKKENNHFKLRLT